MLVDDFPIVDPVLDVLPEVDRVIDGSDRTVPVENAGLSGLGSDVQAFEGGFEAEGLLQLLKVLRLGPVLGSLCGLSKRAGSAFGNPLRRPFELCDVPQRGQEEHVVHLGIPEEPKGDVLPFIHTFAELFEGSVP